jgi:putative transcriptional regulator
MERAYSIAFGVEDALAISTGSITRAKRLKPVPRAKVIRRALHLTQEEFAACFQIPLGTLRDWEQGKTEPDQAARAYLRVIARNPQAVMDALQQPAPEAERVSTE